MRATWISHAGQEYTTHTHSTFRVISSELMSQFRVTRLLLSHWHDTNPGMKLFWMTNPGGHGCGSNGTWVKLVGLYYWHRRWKRRKYETQIKEDWINDTKQTNACLLTMVRNGACTGIHLPLPIPVRKCVCVCVCICRCEVVVYFIRSMYMSCMHVCRCVRQRLVHTNPCSRIHILKAQGMDILSFAIIWS